MGPTTSVLICDDRPTVGLELSQTFRVFLPSIAPVTASVVADGFALVDAFEQTPADLVLIGIHADTTAGIDAINLLLGLHPRANTVVYGSVIDVELLAAAYARGAGGLLVWEASSSGRPTRQPGRTAGCAGQVARPARSHRR
jgi:DNA-binding NarL/FixJ family response regulator